MGTSTIDQLYKIFSARATAVVVNHGQQNYIECKRLVLIDASLSRGVYNSHPFLLQVLGQPVSDWPDRASVLVRVICWKQIVLPYHTAPSVDVTNWGSHFQNLPKCLHSFIFVPHHNAFQTCSEHFMSLYCGKRGLELLQCLPSACHVAQEFARMAEAIRFRAPSSGSGLQ